MRLQSRHLVVGTFSTGVLHLALVLSSLCWARPAAADSAQTCSRSPSTEFGTIAAGTKAEFAFKFTNKYLYGVHVARVRSSCGCSDVRVTKDSLATYESGQGRGQYQQPTPARRSKFDLDGRFRQAAIRGSPLALGSTVTVKTALTDQPLGSGQVGKVTMTTQGGRWVCRFVARVPIGPNSENIFEIQVAGMPARIVSRGELRAQGWATSFWP